jgi:2-oxoglutarate dehydrogenase E2 component (dihydrolipoamide succinyltransferase)
MAIEIRVPALGESVVDAVVARWLKHEGDAVAQGETLVELETEKVNLEVAAEDNGVLQTILKQAGAVVAVGDVLGTIGESAPARPVAAPQPASDHRPPSPLARRMAAAYDVDLSQVRSTSTHGRVTKDDVIHYLEQRKSGPLPAVASTPEAAAVQTGLQPPLLLPDMAVREERVRLSRRRETIARRLVEVQRTAAMLTTFNEIDMSAIIAVRARRKEALRERYQVSLGFMSFFTRAVVGALKAFPHLNAEIEGHEMVLKHYYDIGIAVSTDEGLVVPVVREADRKSFAQLEREIADLARRARINALSLADLQGGTFTITNGGVFGSLLSTPILNGPQVGILGMHTIQERPVVVEGQIVVRPMMYVALSYDHRIVDGSEAVRFLVRVKELAQDPEALLLEG